MEANTPWYTYFGPIVKAKRRSLNWSGNDFSEHVDISPNHLRAFEAGKKGLSVEVLFRIIRALDIPLEDVMNIPALNENNVQLGSDDEKTRYYAEQLIQLVGENKEQIQVIVEMLRFVLQLSDDKGLFKKDES